MDTDLKWWNFVFSLVLSLNLEFLWLFSFQIGTGEFYWISMECAKIINRSLNIKDSIGTILLIIFCGGRRIYGFRVRAGLCSTRCYKLLHLETVASSTRPISSPGFLPELSFCEGKPWGRDCNKPNGWDIFYFNENSNFSKYSAKTRTFSTLALEM